MTQEPKFSPENSPLQAANFNELESLFSRDPLDLTAEDERKIVEELRRYRTKWKADEAAGKKVAKAPKTPKVAASATLSLSDLGLVP